MTKIYFRLKCFSVSTLGYIIASKLVSVRTFQCLLYNIDSNHQALFKRPSIKANTFFLIPIHHLKGGERHLSKNFWTKIRKIRYFFTKLDKIGNPLEQVFTQGGEESDSRLKANFFSHFLLLTTKMQITLSSIRTQCLKLERK